MYFRPVFDIFKILALILSVLKYCTLAEVLCTTECQLIISFPGDINGNNIEDGDRNCLNLSSSVKTFI